jgi:predicted nucleic acid-binding protein
VLLIDASAWARWRQPDVRDRLATAMADGELVVCLPFLLEVGYSTRSGPDHARLMGDLALLPRVELGPDIERLALRTQGELAAVGHHRVPPADLMLAACAHRSGHGILHYDRDYDVIAAHTSLDFASEWVAPAGSID